MIDNIILTSVDKVSDKLTVSNVALTVGNSTLLGALVHAATTPVVDNYPNTASWKDAWLKSISADTIAGTSSNFVIGDSNDATTIVPASIFAESLHEATEIIANAVQSAMAATSTIVKPSILKAIETVQAQVNIKNKPVSPIEIIDVHLLPQWEHNVTQRLLDRYKPLIGTSYPRREIPRMEKPENLDQILTSGSKDIDDLFNSLLKETGLTLTELFNSIFHSSENLGEWPKDWQIQRNVVLAQLLFVAIASENPWIGSGMSSAGWSGLFNGMANALGGLAAAMYERHLIDVKNRTLVYPTSGEKLYVCGELYSQWLDEGGTPEILIGLTLNRDWSHSDYAGLLENKDEFLKAWRAWYTAQQYKQESEHLAIVRSSVYRALATLISDADPAYLRTSKSALIDIASKAANGLEPQHCTDLGETLVRLVCDIVYPHYPAKRFIQRVGELVARGDEPQVAQGLAIAEYINDWLCAQVGLHVI